MKKCRKVPAVFSLSAAAALMLAGCTRTVSKGRTEESTEGKRAPGSAVEASYRQASGAENAVLLSSDLSGRVNIKDSDYETDWASEEYVTVTADENGCRADGKGVSFTEGAIRITEEGTYVLSGSFRGTITVDTGDEDAKVRLVLNGFTGISQDGPALLALTADKVTLTMAEGTQNILSDSESYSDTDYDAAIFSKTDLVLNGSGSLTVQGLYKKAVHSKDDLRITGGIYETKSVDDGFVGKDRLEITGGTFDVTTESEHGDAFKSTNTEEEDKGFIYIEGGIFRIHSADEGFQSASQMLVSGGTFDILAQGKGFHADKTLEFTGGNVTVTASYEGLEAPVITISGGNFDITSSDDGINAAGGGVDTSAEDSESESGQADGPGNWFRRGWESQSTGYLYIHGGTVHINASGDGIDSNTSIIQTGGTITVDGPVSNMDGALDYDDTYEISGGSVMAVGSSGMLQTVSDTSSVGCLAVVYTDTQPAGHTITITDASGAVVTEYTPAKEYKSFVYASGDLEQGAAYTVYSGGTELFSITLDRTVTLVDESGKETTAGWGRWGGWHS